MIKFRYEPPIEVSGRTLIVVSRVKLGWLWRNRALAFFGDKRPAAIIIRDENGEEIFGVDGERMDIDMLHELAVRDRILSL